MERSTLRDMIIKSVFDNLFQKYSEVKFSFEELRCYSL